MLAKAGESDRAIKVKMVRSVALSLNFFFLPVGVYRGCRLFVPVGGPDVKPFSVFSICLLRGARHHIHFFFFSAETSLLWETEGREDKPAISSTLLAPRGIHSVSSSISRRFLYLLPSFHEHTACTPLHFFHHTRADIETI